MQEIAQQMMKCEVNSCCCFFFSYLYRAYVGMEQFCTNFAEELKTFVTSLLTSRDWIESM